MVIDGLERRCVANLLRWYRWFVDVEEEERFGKMGTAKTYSSQEVGALLPTSRHAQVLLHALVLVPALE